MGGGFLLPKTVTSNTGFCEHSPSVSVSEPNQSAALVLLLILRAIKKKFCIFWNKNRIIQFSTAVSVSCAYVNVFVFLFFSAWFCAGSQASPQDRFLIMAAEMENAGSQDLSQFWKEVPKTKIMEHRSAVTCWPHVMPSFYFGMPPKYIWQLILDSVLV